MILFGAILMLVSVLPVQWATTANYRRFQLTRENSLSASEAVATVAGFLMLVAGIVLFVVGLAQVVLAL